jgi:predicted Zn-dependent peptidase
MREVNNAQGQLMKKMMNTAFEVHPYKYTTIGEKEDIENITRQDVKSFLNRHYGAQNLTFVLYGDFDVKTATAFANKYLTQIPAREKSLPLTVIEPKQTAEKRFTVDYDAAPMMMISYHVPAASDPDNEAIEALAAILGQNDTSPLIKTLVYEKKLALYAYSFAGLPGSKYPNLFNILLAPNSGVDVDECLAEIDNVISEFLANGVSDKELESYRKNSKKRYINQLDTGIYLPMQIGLMEVISGDYTDFFTTLEKIDSLKNSDIVKVANKYLIPSNRTIGILEKAGE